jgi:hypothetical protein
MWNRHRITTQTEDIHARTSTQQMKKDKQRLAGN